MAELKTKVNDASVEAFIESVESDQKREDCEALIALMREATGEEPKMWGASIVGFGLYSYKYETGREGEWFRVGFAPRKRNLVLYIMPGFDGYDELMSRLGKHKTGKSCLYINKLADVEQDVLRELVDASLEKMTVLYD